MRRINPDYDEQLNPLLEAMGTYYGTRDRFVENALTAATFSIEYANRRPLNQPSLSDISLLYSKKPRNMAATISANLGFTFYNSLPQNMMNMAPMDTGHFRNLQASAQIERSIGEIASFDKATFTLAGYYAVDEGGCSNPVRPRCHLNYAQVRRSHRRWSCGGSGSRVNSVIWQVVFSAVSLPV